MQIVTVCFDYEERPEFGKLLDVFRHSVHRLMPTAEFIELRPTPPPIEGHRVPGFLDNTFKLAQWVEFMDKTKDNVIFSDCDMLALQDASRAFDQDFDIAYTGCPDGYKVPLNGGIVMAKPTAAARAFLHEMKRVNDMMFDYPAFHEQWRAKYAGMNQAAFGCLLETRPELAKLHRFDTREWNAIDCDLRLMDNRTVFLHMRQTLRNNVLAGGTPAGIGKRAMELWYMERDRMQGKEVLNDYTEYGRGAVTSMVQRLGCRGRTRVIRRRAGDVARGGD